MSSRRPLVGGNWKMHLTRTEARDLAAGLASAIGARRSAGELTEVVLFPSPTLLAPTVGALDGALACGGQDIHPADAGAHTGDVSGPQLVDAGCEWVLCGHSERRADHHEGDALVGEKAAAAIRHGLTPLICVGETAEERRAGRTLEVLERQVTAALEHRPEPMALAYEPVWAIGTGETATPEIAQQAHAFLRETLADLIGAEAAGARRILYGGSVKPGNADSLIAAPDIDGFLVGGASLDVAGFSAIIRVCDRG